MAASFALPAVLSPPLTGRDAIIDALHRCVMAFDTNDAELFDTSFASGGVFDVNNRVMEGLNDIHENGLALIFKLDTTHLVSGVRVSMIPDDVKIGSSTKGGVSARLVAIVIAQHFVQGKGLEDNTENLMSGSLYQGDLHEHGDGLWKFERLVIRPIWVQGEWSVVGGDPKEKLSY